MNIINIFKINDKKSLKILIPDFKNKFNYYYKQTKKLHMFDEVTVALTIKNKQYILKVDVLDFVTHKFKNLLYKTLNNPIQLPDNIEIGNLGFYYNAEYYNENYDNINFSNFWLWSGQNIQTWLYNKNNKIYLEISPSYPWLFSDEKEEKGYVTFDEFMKTYKPVALEEIDRAIAQEWLKQCDEILNSMIKV